MKIFKIKNVHVAIVLKGVCLPAFIGCLIAFLPRHLSAQEGYDVFLIRDVVPFGEQGFAALFLDHPDDPTRMRLDFFNPDNTQSYSRIISLERQGIRAKYEGAFSWGGKLNILTSLYYPGPKRNHLIIQQYSVPELQELRSLVVDEAYTPQLYRIPFGYAMSPDSSKIMCYAWSYTLPKDPARVSVTVLDTELDTVWKQRYILPYNNESLYIYNCRLTDDGRAFLLCENYQGKVGGTIDENKIDHFVLGAEKGSENMIIYDLKKPGYTLRGLHIDPAPGNAMAGAAFYQEPGKDVHLGIFAFYIPPAGGQMTQQSIPIAKENYQEAYPFPNGDGLGNANRHRFEAYTVQQVEFMPDSSMMVVAEQEYYSEATGVLEHNDILALRLRQGRISWMTRIPKRQSESYNKAIFTPFSYKMLKNNEKWYFLFNDEERNYSSDLNTRWLSTYVGDMGTAVATELNPSNGSLRWHLLTRLLREKSVRKIWTSHCWDLNTRDILIFGEGSVPVIGQNYLIGISWDELRRQPSLQWKP